MRLIDRLRDDRGSVSTALATLMLMGASVTLLGVAFAGQSNAMAVSAERTNAALALSNWEASYLQALNSTGTPSAADSCDSNLRACVTVTAGPSTATHREFTLVASVKGARALTATDKFVLELSSATNVSGFDGVGKPAWVQVAGKSPIGVWSDKPFPMTTATPSPTPTSSPTSSAPATNP